MFRASPGTGVAGNEIPAKKDRQFRGQDSKRCLGGPLHGHIPCLETAPRRLPKVDRRSAESVPGPPGGHYVSMPPVLHTARPRRLQRHAVLITGRGSELKTDSGRHSGRRQAVSGDTLRPRSYAPGLHLGRFWAPGAWCSQERPEQFQTGPNTFPQNLKQQKRFQTWRAVSSTLRAFEIEDFGLAKFFKHT